MSKTIFIFTVSAFLGCATLEKTGPVGTWKWVSVEDNPAPAEFYIRYYEDGKCASWPTPHEPISTGECGFENGKLVIYRDKSTPIIADVEFLDNKMMLVTDDGVRLIYIKIEPSLEPGTKPNN